MKYRVIIQSDAYEDLKQNATWWAENYSPDQALRWLETAVAAIGRLSVSPERHALAPENGEFPYEIRQITFGASSKRTHRAIFVIRGQTVHVLTVRSGAQDVIGPDDVGGDSTS